MSDRAKPDPLAAVDAAIARLRDSRSIEYPARTSDDPVGVVSNPLIHNALPSLPGQPGAKAGSVADNESVYSETASTVKTHRISSSHRVERVERVKPTNVNGLGLPDPLSAGGIESLERVVSGFGWREHYEERAAIMEFEGGLPRDEAEDRAFVECLALVAELMLVDDVHGVGGQRSRQP